MSNIIKKLLLFILPLPALYAVAVIGMSMVQYGDTNLMKIASRNPVQPGEFGFTLERLSEVETYRDIDILFLGSSHCYRTFDTRFFAENGLKTFNLGTTGQTPLNGFYLMKRHFDRLRPQLVVIELYYKVMDRDGLESLYDLSINSTYSPEMLEMALSINSPHAINDVLGRFASDKLDVSPEIEQVDIDGELYVPGGYVRYTKMPAPEELQHLNDTTAIAKTDWIPAPEQLDYIGKMIEFAHAQNSKVLLITKPSPPAIRHSLNNPEEPGRQFRAIADKYGVDYINYNGLLKYPGELFYDYEYLNQNGILKFNQTLLDTIVQKNLLPEKKQLVDGE